MHVHINLWQSWSRFRANLKRRHLAVLQLKKSKSKLKIQKKKKGTKIAIALEVSD